MTSSVALRALDGGGLRHAVRDQGFARGDRACHRREHVRLRMLRWNLRKVRWQRVRGNERPRSVQARRLEPASGEADVVVLVAAVEEDVVGGVGDFEQRRVGDRRELRLAVQMDECGRLEAHVNGRDRVAVGLLHRVVGHQGDRIGFLGEVLGLIELESGDELVPPRALNVVRLVPVAGGIEIVGAGGLVEEDQRAGVDHPQEARPRKRAQRRLAVHEHEQGGRVAHDDPRRSVGDRERAGRAGGLGHREVRLQALERDHHRLPVGRSVVERRDEARRLELLGRELGPDDAEVVERHHPGRLVHLGAGGVVDDAVGRLGQRGGLHADRRARAEDVALPALDLRLVDGELVAARVDRPRPGIDRDLAGGRALRVGRIFRPARDQERQHGAREQSAVIHENSPRHFGNISCTWTRICQLAPSSGWTTL